MSKMTRYFDGVAIDIDYPGQSKCWHSKDEWAPLFAISPEHHWMNDLIGVFCWECYEQYFSGEPVIISNEMGILKICSWCEGHGWSHEDMYIDEYECVKYPVCRDCDGYGAICE